MGLLDRMIKSGDIIRIEKTDAQEHIYSLVFSHGCFQIEFKDLSKLFIKAFGKAIYCNSIHADGENHQLHKLSEEEFCRLVEKNEFTVYIDDQVYTLKNYPESDASEVIKNMLNTDLYDPSLEMDNRFIQSQCMQFEEVLSKTIENQ